MSLCRINRMNNVSDWPSGQIRRLMFVHILYLPQSFTSIWFDFKSPTPFYLGPPRSLNRGGNPSLVAAPKLLQLYTQQSWHHWFWAPYFIVRMTLLYFSNSHLRFGISIYPTDWKISNVLLPEGEHPFKKKSVTYTVGTFSCRDL